MKFWANTFSFVLDSVWAELAVVTVLMGYKIINTGKTKRYLKEFFKDFSSCTEH